MLENCETGLCGTKVHTDAEMIKTFPSCIFPSKNHPKTHRVTAKLIQFYALVSSMVKNYFIRFIF